MIKKRALIFGFLMSAKGQKMIKEAYRKYNTQENREKVTAAAVKAKDKAVQMKAKAKTSPGNSKINETGVRVTEVNEKAGQGL